jgi:hypothetical protein
MNTARNGRDGQPYSFVNRSERNILVGAFTGLGMLMFTGTWMADGRSARVAAVVAAVLLWMIAVRSVRRPSLTLGSRGLKIRGPVWNRELPRSTLVSARLGEKRVGMFKRSTLYVGQVDGTEVDLGRLGIWARRGSAQELELLNLARHLEFDERAD